MRIKPAQLSFALLGSLSSALAHAADSSWGDAAVAEVNQQVIDWRHTIHQNPELGNMEVKTSALVAKQLEAAGIQVRTGVGKTGVVGVLKGGKPGPVVAGEDMSKVANNHSPYFTADDTTLATGVKAHVQFVLNYPERAGKS